MTIDAEARAKRGVRTVGALGVVALLVACGGSDAPAEPNGGAGAGGAGGGSAKGGSGGGSSSAGGGGSSSGGSGSGSGSGGGSGGGGSGGSGGSSGSGGGGGGGSSGSSGSAGKAPTLFYDFVKGDAGAFYEQKPFGAITFGMADPGAHDQNAAALVWNANTAAVGPGGNATEIGTLAAHGFGEYRFRVRLATCALDEELVNGLFTYQNDGKDHDGNGLIDNLEIDIEILCGQPGFLNLTSWTDYTSDTMMRKKSRIVDLDTGTIYVGANDGYGLDTADPLNETVDPALKHPGWYDPTAYYELGFDWQKGSIRYFIVLGGQEVTLWTLTDATRIPQGAAAMLFNLWHPSDHWNAPGAAAPAKKQATLSVDWFSYTAAP